MEAHVRVGDDAPGVMYFMSFSVFGNIWRCRGWESGPAADMYWYKWPSILDGGSRR